MNRVIARLVLLALAVFVETHAFDSNTLKDITREVLENAVVTLGFTGDATFTPSAIRAIARANGRLDRTREGLSHKNAFWSFYNEEFQRASRRLMDLKEFVVATLTLDSTPDVEGAREKFGEALHTLQDFYAHTNWIELGNVAINTDLGNAEIPDPLTSLVTCDASGNYIDTITDLTSGYDICRGIRSNVPTGKCCRNTIDKEGQTATDLAIAATADYLDQVITELRNRDSSELAIRSFLGRDESVAFLIDTTESMREELITIQEVIEEFIARFDGNQRGRYILLAFADSPNDDTDEAIVEELITPNPAEVVTAVQALTADASGADDCREAGFAVLERALDLSPRNSNIYFWSDASQKGNEFGPFNVRIFRYLRLRVRAIRSRVRINFVMTGRCLPFGSTYRTFKSLARVTGGSVYHFENPEDMRSLLLGTDEIIVFNTEPDVE
jgi:hypothetical protein